MQIFLHLRKKTKHCFSIRLILTFYKTLPFLIEENARWFHKTKISFMPN